MDLNKLTRRRGTDSIKWKVSKRELPMWVADMDFESPTAVIKAIKKRANHGIFGYATVSDKWYGAYISWWRERHGVEYKKEWLSFVTGVVPTLSCAVKSLTEEGDGVIVMSPVYHMFFNVIENCGRHAVENKLIYKDGEYSIDFEDLEKKLAYKGTTMLFLCNPHNPIGKIWTRGELWRIGKLCARFGVTVVADEIHCDIAEPGREYIPFASVSEECRDNAVICMSVTKTFNLAGIQSAAVCVPNERLREKLFARLQLDGASSASCFAGVAATAALTDGAEWLDAVNEYISENRKIAGEFIEASLPAVHMVSQDATYLLWLDVSEISRDSEEFCEFLRKKTGLFLSNGKAFRGDGAHFVRMNIACQRERLLDGLERLKNGIEEYISEKK